MGKYGVRELQRDFGSEGACLRFLFEASHSYACSCGGSYSLLKGRKQFQCSKCRFQIAPTSGTIFHKSSTPLSLWFLAIFLFSNAKSGLSAKQLERDLNVTYKTAWRMLMLIRQSLVPEGKLSGTVEVDETYMGGVQHGGGPFKNKAKVMGIVERKGRVRATLIEEKSDYILLREVRKNVRKGSTVMTDNYGAYRKLPAFGYKRLAVTHSKKEWVRGSVHTNTIDGFWGHVKRSVAGVHKVVSKQHLQSYLNGYAWHYNMRHNDKERFFALIGAILLSSE